MFKKMASREKKQFPQFGKTAARKRGKATRKKAAAAGVDKTAADDNNGDDDDYDSSYDGMPYSVRLDVPSDPLPLMRCPHCNDTLPSKIAAADVPQVSWWLGCLPRCSYKQFYFHFCQGCDRPVARLTDEDFVPGEERFNRQVDSLGAPEDVDTEDIMETTEEEEEEETEQTRSKSSS